jgi:ribosomal RNA methyltransferase Nop2
MSSDAESDDSGSEEESDDSSERKGKSGFTDENASWLKPKPSKKSQLLSSDDSDDEDEDGDESVNDEGDLLEIERESKLLDKQMEQEKVEAEVEFQRTIAENTAVFHLPTAEELVAEVDGTRVVPPSEIRERINDIIAVLSDFKNRREPNKARSDYITQLTSDLAETFGYLPELVEYFLTMFNPSETLEFLEASDSPRPLVIRTNTLKTRRKDLAASLLKRGVTLDPLATWSKVGLKITASQIPIGATPEYLSGQYMLQSAASFCPVLALNPSPGKELVLDMSAAPGGKTSYIAQLMRNTGIIVANDLKPERQKATVANLHRLGVKNTITCCHDGRKLGKLWKNRFTKILLDAPCSGLGVISRDPSVKIQRTIKDVERCGVLQKELLLNAIDALSIKGKEGGVMVYSTCSVSIAENEEVINYILNKRDVKLINCGLDFGEYKMK